MEVFASAAMSLDGYLDDASPQRLILSSAADLLEVYRLRSLADAVLVGAGTIRSDNPSLVTKHAPFAATRQATGQPRDPIKVTLTQSGDLDPKARFFTEGSDEKLVFCPESKSPELVERLAERAIIISVPGATVRAVFVVDHLRQRGCRRLFVEGGSAVLSMFFRENVVDRFRLAVAPFFIGQPAASRLVQPGIYPFGQMNRMQLEKTEMFGDTAAMTYRLEKL